MTNWFELDHNLDLWILKVKCDLVLWPHRWPWPWIFMVKFWNSCISEWEGWLTLHKGGGSRSFMTIWWPRSGVWIYQVVTGVTSVVGVPSTHLVLVGSMNLLGQMSNESISKTYLYKKITIVTSPCPQQAMNMTQAFNSSDARDGIFWFIWSILCLLMP